MPSLSRSRTRRWLRGAGTASARLALPRRATELLLLSRHARRGGSSNTCTRSRRPEPSCVRTKRPGPAAPRGTRSHGSTRDRRVGNECPATVWNLRPSRDGRVTNRRRTRRDAKELPRVGGTAILAPVGRSGDRRTKRRAGSFRVRLRARCAGHARHRRRARPGPPGRPGCRARPAACSTESNSMSTVRVDSPAS